jgi:hypothetical protein
VNGECVAFQWLGQPVTSCDDCGKPAWEHDYYRDAPWQDNLIGTWLADGLISRQRAAALLVVEARRER